jgi:hypothetical protein
VTRPCRWPDGGCGEPIIDVVTVKGAKQVLDAQPGKGIVLVDSYGHLGTDVRPSEAMARVVDVYVDHHATCSKWPSWIERHGPRAAKAAGS